MPFKIGETVKYRYVCGQIGGHDGYWMPGRVVNSDAQVTAVWLNDGDGTPSYMEFVGTEELRRKQQ